MQVCKSVIILTCIINKLSFSSYDVYVCEQFCQEKVVFTGSTASAHSPDCLGQEKLEVEGHVTQSLAKPCKGD